jgi:drug/metabolite transporter (DMT)-like permease
MPEVALGLAAACGASVLYDLGIALQALDARRVPVEHALRPSLLARLARRRRWLIATAIALAGYPMQILALGLAPLTVVQPALAAGLLLLLALGARMLGEPVGRREIAATAAIVVGVGGIAVVAPERTTDHAGAIGLALPLSALALAALAPVALRESRLAAGPAVAIAAGCAFAWTGIAAKLVSDELAAGRGAVALVWLTASGAVALVGLLGEMTALQRMPVTRVAPLVFVTQVVLPVLIAPVVAGEGWGGTPARSASLVAMLALVAAGSVALCRSRAVAGMIGAA